MLNIIEKSRQIAENSETLTIAYIREDGYPRASTISKLKADGVKTIYMATGMQSPKTKRIQANPKVSLCFKEGENNITLTGKVTVTQDNDLRHMLWQDWLINHFPDGVAGESYCVFIFETEEAEFWIDDEGASAERCAL